MPASSINPASNLSPIPQDTEVFLRTPNAHKLAQDFASLMAKDTITLDGVRIRVAVETKRHSVLPNLRQLGSEGIGIFETDGIAQNLPDSKLPSYDRQLIIYQNLQKFSFGQDLCIRTIVHDEPGTRSKILCRRGVRFSLCDEGIDEFRVQLSATMCAASNGGIKLLVPKVSGVQELQKVREEIANCQKILGAAGLKFNTNMPVGVIFEVISSAVMAESIAKKADFLHIRLSTFAQLLFAADARNPKVSHLIDPAYQSFLRGVKMVADASAVTQKPLSMSGFMKTGDNLRYIPLFVGLGAQELYPNLELLPAVKLLISRMKFSDAKTLADEALESESSKRTISRCEELVRSCLPEFFIPSAAMLPGTFRTESLNT